MALKKLEFKSTSSDPPDLSFLTEQERAKILTVVKRDAKLKITSLTVLRKSMENLQKECEDFSQSCSMCGTQFSVFCRQAQCAQCKKNNVCSRCLEKNKTDFCQLCIRERQYNFATVDYMPVFSKAAITALSPYGSDLIHRSLDVSKSRSTPSSPTRQSSLALSSQLLRPLRKSCDGGTNLAGNSVVMRHSVSNENLVETRSVYSEHCGEVAGGVRGKVCFAVWYKTVEECLYIRVIKAKDLAAAKRDGTSSPYVKTYLLPDRSKRSKRKTSFCRNTTNPNFEEILKYKLPIIGLSKRELWLSLWDQDTLGRNQFLGEVRLKLSSLDLTDIKEHWYPLQKKLEEDDTKAPHNRGKIRIGLKIEASSLYISVTQADGLPQMDNSGKANAFARTYLLPNQDMGSKKKTRTAWGSLSPLWNEELLYHGVTAKELESQRVLEVTVWEKDNRDNEFIGGLRLGPDPIVSIQRRVWMDSSEAEASHWEAMLATPGEWVERWHTLRPSMDTTLTVKRHSSMLKEKLSKKMQSPSCLPVPEQADSLSCNSSPSHLKETSSGSTWPHRRNSKKEPGSAKAEKYDYEITGEILVGVQYRHKSLHVSINRAKGLAAADSNGFSDPYVKTYLLPDRSKASSKRKTQVKKKTLNPVYNEEFKYEVTPEEVMSRTLWLTVWDKDMLHSNQFLGEVYLPLEHLNLASKADKWYKLQSSTSVGSSSSSFAEL